MSSKKRSRETLEKGYSSTHDPACDQCRVKKIRCDRVRPQCLNCSRLGHDCEWSGNGKRPSQMTGISHRLDHLEDSISEMRASLELVIATASASWTNSDSVPGGGNAKQIEERRSCSPPLTPSISPSSPFNQHAFSNAHGCEMHFPSTSLGSLIKAVDEIVLLPLSADASDPHAANNAAMARDQIAAIDQDNFEVPRQDGLNPSLPPLAMLEAMVDVYFDSINSYFPIWRKELFIQLLVSVREQQGTMNDRAVVICLNNMVLLTLMTKSRQALAKDSTRSPDQRGTASMDTDMMDSFLKNAKRAFENIEILLRPRLINVQALLTLCLVALEYSPPGVFRMVFHSAIQVARSIGLHHLDYAEITGSSEERKEQMGVLSCLRILDKSVLWTAGWPVCLPMSDISIQSPQDSPMCEIERYFVAKMKLSRIEEEAFLELFSNESKRLSAVRRNQSASKLNRALQGWWSEHMPMVHDEIPLDDFSSCSNAELNYSFCALRLMVNWPTNKNQDAYARFLSDARASLRLLLRLWEAVSDLGHYGMLQRAIASYPPINLFALCVHSLTNEPTDSDLDLLQSFVSMLAQMTASNETSSHNSQLYKIADILANMLPNSVLRRESTLSSSLLATPVCTIPQQSNNILTDSIATCKPDAIESVPTIDFPGIFLSTETEMPGFFDFYTPNHFSLSPSNMQ